MCAEVAEVREKAIKRKRIGSLVKASPSGFYNKVKDPRDFSKPVGGNVMLLDKEELARINEKIEQKHKSMFTINGEEIFSAKSDEQLKAELASEIKKAKAAKALFKD